MPTLKHHHPATGTAGKSDDDIQMKLTRTSADYFGTYGNLTFQATDPKISQQVGSVSFKTIELPAGTYTMVASEGDKTYPLSTARSVVTGPLIRHADTSPKKLGIIWLFNPPKPPGVAQEDYDVAMDSSVYTQWKSVFTHSGIWSTSSHYCILVGDQYTTVPRVLDHDYPKLERTKTYLIPGFTASSTLTQQLRMNLWILAVEKLLKRPPSMRFTRTGDPKPSGPAPAPLDKLPVSAPKPPTKLRPTSGPGSTVSASRPPAKTH